jgi:transcriptional regulator with XRE-family HTH domain
VDALEGEELVQAGHMAEDIFIRQMKRYRQKLGLSQVDLAARITALGSSMYQQTIAKIESGHRAVRIAEADVIARALETSITDMLSDAVARADTEEIGPTAADLQTQLAATERRLLAAETEVARVKAEVNAAQEALDQAKQGLVVALLRHDRAIGARDELAREFAFLGERLKSMDRQEEQKEE